MLAYLNASAVSISSSAALTHVWDWLTALNWTSFIPDVIVAIVTGVIVGGVLYLLQTKQERRNERSHVVDSSMELKFELQMHAGTLHDSRNFSRIGKLTGNQQAVFDLLSVRPVPEWYRKNATPLVSAMRHFQDATVSLASTAEEVEGAIEIWLRKDNHSQDLGRRYIHAKFLDAPEPVLAVLAPTPGLRDSLDAKVQAFGLTDSGLRSKERLDHSQKFLDDTFNLLSSELFSDFR